ncbi:MAG: hypothetical protein AB1700_01960 [Bacillota bacterium]
MNSVSTVIKETALLAYEDVLTVILTSVIWSLPLLPGILVFNLPWSGLYLAFIAPLAFVPVARFVHLTARHKRRRFCDFPHGLPRMLLSGAALGAMAAAGYMILYASWWYYGRSGSLLYFCVAMLQTYLVLLSMVLLTYTVPVLVQTSVPLGLATRASFRLFFMRPGYTLLLWLQVLTVGAFLLVTTMGFLLLFGGLFALFLNVAAENLLNVHGMPQMEDQ